MQAERDAKVQDVKACEQELQQLQAQLELHADNDPDRFKGMSKHMPDEPVSHTSDCAACTVQ